jgi:hypothetical protein
MSLRPRCPLRSLTLRRSFVCLVALTGLVAGPSTALALEVDQVDVFNTSDTGQFGWTGGSGLSVEANGGPAGAGDAFLRVESFGTGMNSNKLVTHNQDQWTGNYLEAGVTGISMDVRNLGETPITLRIAMGNSSFPGPTDDLGDWMVSTVGISLPAMGAWTNVSFQLGADDFTGSYGAIMGSVLAMRIVNATTTAQPGKGDVVAAVLGVDNITALTSESSIPGDFFPIEGVTGTDMQRWQGDFGANPGSDADGDNDSDGNDFLVWQRNLGQGTSVAATIATPEPTAGILMAWSGIALAAAARRARIRGRS